MEKHRCKFCSKSFSNGRALGGHMKSHLLPSLSTRKRLVESLHHSSASSSSTSSFSGPDAQSPSYKLRENPRKSFRLADLGSSSVDARDAVEESQSDSETGKLRRVRETRKTKKKKKKTKAKTGRNSEEPKSKQEAGRNSNGSTNESPEAVSSVSDASPEEDLAMCLIIMSRDARKRDMKRKAEETEEENMKAKKRQSPELRRCLIDLNMPPAAEDDEAYSIISEEKLV